MTKEEARLTLQENFGYLSEEHPRIIEAMRVAMNILSRTSLPSNLDEAAEEWCKSNNKGIALCADKKSHYLADGTEAFKAGAKWMAEQFQKIEGELVDWYETKGVDYCCGIKTDESFEIPEGFYIRKKQ